MYRSFEEQRDRPPIGFEHLGPGVPPVNTPDFGYPPDPMNNRNYNVQTDLPTTTDFYPPVQSYPMPSGYEAPTVYQPYPNMQAAPPPLGFSSNVPENNASGTNDVPMDDNVRISQPRIGFLGKEAESKGLESVDQRRRSLSYDRFKPEKEETLFFRDSVRRIDYILAYQPGEKGSEKEEKRQMKRKEFEANLRKAGLKLEYEDAEESADRKTFYVKIHAPTNVLFKCAEWMMMKMPIATNNMDTRTLTEKISEACCWNNPFLLDEEDIPEEPNYFTGAFRISRLDKFIMPPEGREHIFTNAQRSRIVHRLLTTSKYGEDKRGQTGINRLIRNGSYNAAYPLHEGHFAVKDSMLTCRPSTDRQLLYYHWARPGRWFKEQPLDLIRKYFGEKIGIYFSWLGVYTTLLFPAALLGAIAIIYGVATVKSDPLVNEVCSSSRTEFPMCPRCDDGCPYWSLADSCQYARAAYILDNVATVVFAVFMSFWATSFLEFWKRKQADIIYQWDLAGFEDEEEQPRAEYEAALTSTRVNPITQIEEPYLPILYKIPRYFTAFTVLLFMITVVIVAVLSVVTYRVAVNVSLAKRKVDSTAASLIASFTAALINLIAIVILNKIYEWIAWHLTSWEMPRTQTNFDDIYTFKMYIFQFVNFYSSLFYIAFFKLDPGRPAKYNRVFGYRREECNPAGCLFELGVQLMVTMVGKQLLNNIIEILVPKLRNWWKSRGKLPDQTADKLSRWERDFDLIHIPPHGLFYEYLEMVIQFGFITLFVAAFPLGPLFAFLNNLVEIRVDAYKYTSVFRRPMAQRAQDIGIWFPILKGIVNLSVIVNAFVIGFVSEFVPRLYYKIVVSPTHDLTGYLNYTLSCFDVADFEGDEKPHVMNFNNGSCGYGKPTCRFRGFYQDPYILMNNQVMKNPSAYKFKADHWHIIAVRLFFVVVFEHVVFFLSGLTAWVIPDVPKELDNQIKRENFLAREIRAEEAALKDEDRPTSPLST